ncbi:MAG: hypothetical protein KDK70_10075 [Myxococcales bacterium]|nr:hypothetical protein [Myxococcales bacterium]
MTAPPVERLARWLAPVVPASRLALVRIAVCLYACAWLGALGPDLLARTRLPPERFDPVGLAGPVGVVSPGALLIALVVVIGLGLLVAAGRAHRVGGPAFALGLAWILSYRNSWGHLSHAEHLLVLHVAIVALAPADHALRLGSSGPAPPDHERYGWPLRLMMLVTVSTYAIAGLAKLRAGGLAWISGDTVQLHVAHEVLRTRRVGAEAAWLGPWLLPHAGAFSAIAVATVVLELGAPLALRAGRLRAAWLGGLWAMHLGIWAVMGIGFAYPLSGVAFTPFLPLERAVAAVRAWARRARARARP